VRASDHDVLDAAVEYCTARWLARHPRIAARQLKSRVGEIQLAALGVTNPHNPRPLTDEQIADASAVIAAVADLLDEVQRMRALRLSAVDVLAEGGEA
jgi:hypothetical protein